MLNNKTGKIILFIISAIVFFGAGYVVGNGMIKNQSASVYRTGITKVSPGITGANLTGGGTTMIIRVNNDASCKALGGTIVDHTIDGYTLCEVHVSSAGGMITVGSLVPITNTTTSNSLKVQ